MANPDIQTWFDNPDPDESPLNLQQLFALATRLVHSRVDPQDVFLNVLIQSIEPSPEHRDNTLWVRQDSVGRPAELKLWFNGHWRRVYNGMMGEIRAFTGAPGYGAPPALFNTNGRGNIGLEYDGWHICNGKDGVVDLSDKFILGAHMNKSPNNTHPDYDNGWQTWQKFAGDEDETTKKTGGVNGTMIEMKHLPPMDNSIADPETGNRPAPGLYINGKEAKDAAAHTEIQPLIDINYANLKPHSKLLISYGADPAGHDGSVGKQKPYPTLPPFYCMAWITFVGYENA